MQNLVIYNTLHRQKERFQPIAAPHVGMYVCGPTVYGDPHLGHARPAITFDILFRYLQHIGYKVRYVRNITDVGHLEHDADEGDDKIEKKARLEQLEPMEIAQFYANRYHDAMHALNVLPPSIEPCATGHIIEQEELVKEILANGYAYESNGSIYFDVAKYDKDHKYGILSGRNLNDMINNSRELNGVGEKRNQVDFALWKRAMPEHIMRWPSPWSDGFPGWHCECTAMGRKYLGKHFDIHGGGMDLIFPHHECEIAQAVAAQGEQMVKYWMHNNMITINGQKMGKSLNNFITLEQFFTGNHETLQQAYSPMTIRFFILSAHYRGTVDFSNEALQAAQKGYEKLMNGIEDLKHIQTATASDENTKQFVSTLRQKCYDAMNDDLMTPAVISNLFEACHIVNLLIDHKAQISKEDLKELSETMHLFAFDILGLVNERGANNDAREAAYGKVVDMVLDLRAKAKANKDWAVSDQIRDALAEAGFQVKDTKDGVTWKLDK
ncbi:cysteine--tRNA ligase [Prevotella pallens]|jgi:cysteine--tRNA ligase|uniref:cysteine--tRNA ligase n=2 Tax=Prevotella pallens TaxID=60133 RepID=UPI001CAD9C50|nr:cysteine--tRNA ligase [Prevotella pallens]MBF1508551.1 cysteine--tRNA ligase [Prevotella pallens]MBF1510349.1 cysteine--tRNA ligase [Prevotella pallens]